MPKFLLLDPPELTISLMRLKFIRGSVWNLPAQLKPYAELVVPDPGKASAEKLWLLLPKILKGTLLRGRSVVAMSKEILLLVLLLEPELEVDLSNKKDPSYIIRILEKILPRVSRP